MSHADSIQAPAIPPDRALQELLMGNRRYVSGAGLHPRQSPYHRSEVASAQHPFAVVVGCSDSRVPPEIIFDCGVGDVFVIRTAGHVLDDAGLASVQYAAEHLGVELIVVLGHSGCGAVHATVDNLKALGPLGKLLERIRPAIDAASGRPGELLNNAVVANIRLTVTRMKSAGPILAGMIPARKLTVVGALYDLASGQVTLVE